MNNQDDVARLLSSIKSRPIPFDLNDKSDLFPAMVQRAKAVAKRPVEQEFPGLVSIGILPHFMLPGIVFFHESTGVLIHGSLALIPGIAPMGREWMAAPMVVRYPVTQAYNEQDLVHAIRATYLQAIVVPGFTEEQERTGNVETSVLIGDAEDQTEVAPGVMEVYLLACFKTGENHAKHAAETMETIVNKWKDEE